MLKLPAVYPIVDTGLLRKQGVEPLKAVESALEAGAQILQFRAKGFVDRSTLLEMREAAKLCGEASALFVVNDRADLALLLDAALHLGQDDLPPQAARKVTGASTVIGFSTHNETQLRAGNEEPVSYLALGPIFGTRSKENPDPVVGTAELRRLRNVTTKPLVAIGGVTLQTADEVWNAGADSIAIIGAWLAGESTKEGMRKRVQDWLAIGPAQNDSLSMP